MSRVSILISGRKKADYEKDSIGIIQSLLERSGFYGEFSVVPERRCPGAPQYQGISGIRISAARQNDDILLKVQPGDNGTCREYYLKLHVSEGMDRDGAMRRLEEGKNLLVVESSSRKTKKDGASQKEVVATSETPNTHPAEGRDTASQEQPRPDLKGLSQDPTLLQDLVRRLIETVPSRMMPSRGISAVFHGADPELFREGDEHAAGSITRALCNRGLLEPITTEGEKAYRVADKAFEFTGVPTPDLGRQSQSVSAQTTLGVSLDQLLVLGEQISKTQERAAELNEKRKNGLESSDRRFEEAKAEQAKLLAELERLKAKLQAIADERQALLVSLDAEIAEINEFLDSDPVRKFQQLKKMLAE